MNTIFTNYLFSKHYFVSGQNSKDASFETLFSLANLFNIRIVSGQALAEPEMIRTAEACIGRHVPEPFYRGFPQSVRALSREALLFDQLAHYYQSYTCGDFSRAGHSLFEESFQRLAFRESEEIKDFSILTEAEAIEQLTLSVNDLLASTRPLSEAQYQLVLAFVQEYQYRIPGCASKDTAVQLLLDTRNPAFAAFLQLSDVIRILDHLCYENYGNENLKKLNLKNQDRKFLIQIINTIFEQGQCNVIDCFEKKKLWAGLLHHIHYQPINETAEQFVAAMRGRENRSVYSEFEKRMQQSDIQGAVQVLRRGKGSGALLRKLNYILSRCETEADVDAVLGNIHTDNPMILIQLMLDFSAQPETGNARTFKFTKHNLLRVHNESKQEAAHRRSQVPASVRQLVPPLLWKNLERIYHGRLGKVYIDPAMERIAVPLQETTASGGYGVLPRGSRIPIVAGRKIRCFTYWEKVNDIDLSVIALTKGGKQMEFSWRSMYGRQSDAITYSGDETSGYNGGSEYFDVDLEAFRAAYPAAEYLVFCNNVYSCTTFSRCLCKAGYMNRDVLDSGQVFEPKTVATSFQITCDSTFAYLFGVDLNTRELVWLNVARDSNARIAGSTSVEFLKPYLHATSIMNVHKLFSMLATEVVSNPEEADVVVSNEDISVKEGAEIIHSYDTERMLALMNAQS